MFRFRRLGAFLLTLLLTVSMILPAAAADPLIDTADWLQKNVPAPTVASIGGEWAVIGLARSGCEVPQEYWDNYYAAVEDYVVSCKGVLPSLLLSSRSAILPISVFIPVPVTTAVAVP